MTGVDRLENVRRTRIRSFRDGLTPSEVWHGIAEEICEYTRAAEGRIDKDGALVISFPGPLHEDGRIVNAPTVSGPGDTVPDLRSDLSRRTGRAVHILNDISAATLYLARESPWDRFIAVTVSSGIGSKVCVRLSRKLALFDKGPYAGEIGHLMADPSQGAAMCDCGGRGHVGAISSGRGIECLARRRAIRNTAAFSASLCHREFGATAETLTNEKHLVPGIRAEDEWALAVLEEGTLPLAIALNTVMLALGLQGVFVLGGFAFSIGEGYLKVLRELILARCDYSAFPFSADMIQFGQMCEDACLRGAAEYALMVDSTSV